MRNMLGTAVLLLTLVSLVQADAVILRTTDCGASWSQETSNCNEHLNDVAENAAGIAVAVGNNGTILRRSNGTWTDVSVSGITDDLTATMYQLITDRFYAVGENGRVLYSTNAGLTWQSLPQAPIDINDIWFDTQSTSNGIFVCGPNGAVYNYKGSWTWINSGTTNDLYAFAGHICHNHPKYVLGNYGALYNFCTQNTSYLGNVHFRGATDIAYGSGDLVAVAARGVIYRWTSATNWYAVSSGTTNNLYDAAYMGYDTSSNTEVYCAVGSNGTVLRSLDDGQTWSQVFSGTARVLRGVSTYLLGDPEIAYIVGESNSGISIGLLNRSDESSALEITASQSGTLTVTSETDSQVSVVLFDITGRSIEEKSAQISSGNAMINFSAPRGVYLYAATTDGNVTTGKMVISD